MPINAPDCSILLCLMPDEFTHQGESLAYYWVRLIYIGAKDDLGCHLITFQSQQQLLFTQIDYSSLIESLYIIIMYYKR